MGGDSQLMNIGGDIGLMRNVDNKHSGEGFNKMIMPTISTNNLL